MFEQFHNANAPAVLVDDHFASGRMSGVPSLFVQGGQSMLYQAGKSDIERTMIVNALGHKWELTFTTLVTFGGAFFRIVSPLFYATSFGGAYWVWILILFCFIIQAVSYEFRSKADNLLGSSTYEAFLIINGFELRCCFGVVVATLYRQRILDSDELRQRPCQPDMGRRVGGLELAFDLSRYTTYINLSLGLAVMFLSRLFGRNVPA